MSDEKDIFSRIIRDKLGEMEVPYNRAHWNEMNEILDKVSVVEKVPSSSGSLFKYGIIAGVGAAALATWLVLSNKDDEDHSGVEKVKQEASAPVKIDGNHSANRHALSQPNTNQSQSAGEVTNKIATEIKAQNTLENKAEQKVERFGSYSEDNINQTGKLKADQAILDQSQDLPRSGPLNNPELKVSIVFPDQEVFCVGEEIEFGVDREIEGVSYYWDFGDLGLKSRQAKATHTFKSKGSYEVKVIVSKGEKNDNTETRRIDIEGKPDLKMKWDENKVITLNDPYIEFSAQSNQRCDFNWTFNEIKTAHGSTAEFVVPEAGSIPVQLTALAPSGCKTTIDRTYVSSKGIKIFVEKAFNPFNNTGSSDFMPNELRSSTVDFTLAISDLNGNQVFESHQGDYAWDGTLNNSGSSLPTGAYHWMVKFRDDRGVEHKQEGKINLIR